jgi:hypothetical protein
MCGRPGRVSTSRVTGTALKVGSANVVVVVVAGVVVAGVVVVVVEGVVVGGVVVVVVGVVVVVDVELVVVVVVTVELVVVGSVVVVVVVVGGSVVVVVVVVVELVVVGSVVVVGGASMEKVRSTGSAGATSNVPGCVACTVQAPGASIVSVVPSTTQTSGVTAANVTARPASDDAPSSTAVSDHARSAIAAKEMVCVDRATRTSSGDRSSAPAYAVFGARLAPTDSTPSSPAVIVNVAVPVVPSASAVSVAAAGSTVARWVAPVSVGDTNAADWPGTSPETVTVISTVWPGRTDDGPATCTTGVNRVTVTNSVSALVAA